MIDIDHFKEYIDQFSHLDRDNCIRLVANEVSAIAQRPTDLATRYSDSTLEYVTVSIGIVSNTPTTDNASKCQDFIHSIF